MTLGETLHRSLSEWAAAPDGGERSAVGGGWAATVSAEKVDTLGARLTRLDLTRTAPAPDGTTLSGWANGVAERTTGLLESLKVYEVDASHDTAVLRSDGPTVKGDVAEYYEVVLTGTDKASVARYSADRAAGTPRRQVPFTLTHESIAKLADDVAG